MTEPVTNEDIEAAVRQRFDCAHVSVGSWTDDDGKEWFGASLTWDQHPHTGTTWTLLGCCPTREALLRHVQDVELRRPPSCPADALSRQTAIVSTRLDASR
jgi:hypothetical protein